MDTNVMKDILNAGIGAVKTSREVWEKTVEDLSKKKESFQAGFETFKKAGESNFSDPAVKLKVNLAWGLVRFDELRENIQNYFSKKEK